MAKIKWKNKEVVEQMVKDACSISDLLRKANMSVVGANSQTVRKWIDFHGIDDSHFEVGYARVAEFNTARKRSHDDIFCEESDVRQVILRKAFVALNVVPFECDECGLGGVWNNKPIALQLDHINGTNNDNRLDNLRWLCPNCHSQTETFAGRNCSKE